MPAGGPKSAAAGTYPSQPASAPTTGRGSSAHGSAAAAQAVSGARQQCERLEVLQQMMALLAASNVRLRESVSGLQAVQEVRRSNMYCCRIHRLDTATGFIVVPWLPFCGLEGQSSVLKSCFCSNHPDVTCNIYIHMG